MRSALARDLSLHVRVRAAAREDLEALIALEELVFVADRLSRRSLRRLLQSPSAGVLIAEDGTGDLAGSAILLFRARSALARLYSLAVAPPMSGRGIGGLLLQAAEAVALARACSAIRLEAHETNHAAMSRYRKSGYHEFGRRARYYEDGGDALCFEKRLKHVRPS